MIIGIHGKARTGKDTIAKHLINKYNFIRYAFADPIKETINPLFGWNERHSDGELKEVIDPKWEFSPRQAYQKFGTEFGRALNNNLWLIVAEDRIDKNKNYVISDVRFENEATFIRRNGGIVIHVFSNRAQDVNEHISESGINIDIKDIAITNNGTIKELLETIDNELREIIK